MLSTKDYYKISPEEFRFYHENGYLIIKSLVDLETLNSCKKHFSNLCDGTVDTGIVHIVKDRKLLEVGATGENAVNKVQEILFDDVFSCYTEHQRLLQVVSQFIGDEISAIHGMFINKPPNTSRHPTHQDGFFFPHRPSDMVIGVWTAVDDVRLDNGCLYVIPGSHRRNVMYEHENLADATKHYHGILRESELSPPSHRIQLIMRPGDTVLLHPMLLHGSNANVSKMYRKALTCHYASNDCYFIDMKKTIQKKMAEQFENDILTRKGIEVNLNDVWLLKSKIVQTRKNKCHL